MSFELTNLNGEGDEQCIEDGETQNKSSGVLESVLLGDHSTTSDGGSSVADERAQIFNLKSIAIPIFYYTLGFLMRFPYLPLRLYLRNTIVDSPGQQEVVFDVVMCMPWNLKVFIGFFSDTVPIRGQRRKPYTFFETIMCATSWLLFGYIRARWSPLE